MTDATPEPETGPEAPETGPEPETSPEAPASAPEPVKRRVYVDRAGNEHTDRRACIDANEPTPLFGT